MPDSVNGDFGGVAAVALPEPDGGVMSSDAGVSDGGEASVAVTSGVNAAMLSTCAELYAGGEEEVFDGCVSHPELPADFVCGDEIGVEAGSECDLFGRECAFLSHPPFLPPDACTRQARGW